jgi:uncharacterized protein YkwD
VLSTPRRARVALLVALLAGLLVPVGLSSVGSAAAASEPSVESQLLSLTNAARTSAGLPALRTSSSLTSIARSWSNHMAATHSLVHNPSLGSQVSGWRQVGENIAMAWSASQAQSLFMGSSGHRANILNRGYNYVGIGVTKASDGSLWFTVDFMQSASYTPPAKAAPKPAPKPAAQTTHRSTPTSTTRQAAASRATRSTVRTAPKAVPVARPVPVVIPVSFATAQLAGRADGLVARDLADDTRAAQADGTPGLLRSTPDGDEPGLPLGILAAAAIVLTATVVGLTSGPRWLGRR